MNLRMRACGACTRAASNLNDEHCCILRPRHWRLHKQLTATMRARAPSVKRRAHTRMPWGTSCRRTSSVTVPTTAVTWPSLEKSTIFDRDSGGRLVRDWYRRRRTVSLKAEPVRRARKRYSCRPNANHHTSQQDHDDTSTTTSKQARAKCPNHTRTPTRTPGGNPAPTLTAYILLQRLQRHVHRNQSLETMRQAALSVCII